MTSHPLISPPAESPKARSRADRHPTTAPPRRSRLLAVGLGALVLAATAAACQSSTPKPAVVSPAKLFQQGLKAQEAGNPSLARSDYTKVLTQDPNNHAGENKYAYFNLGVIDQSAGNSTGASTEYRKALLVDPTYTSALYNLAIVETPSSPQSAISLYQQILAITPKDPNTLYNLGLLLYDTGQVSQGQSMLQQAIYLAPSLKAKLPSNVTL